MEAGLELKAVGLATHYIASDQMPTVLQHLTDMGTTVRDHSAVNTMLNKLEVRQGLCSVPFRQMLVGDVLSGAWSLERDAVSLRPPFAHGIHV